MRFVPVSRERHGQKKWLRPENYAFAAVDALAPLVGVELAQAARAMPIAFAEQSGQYVLVAVESLTAGKNMFVAPDGRWTGGFIPTCYRSYPFRLIPQEGAGDAVVCVDEDSQLIVDGGSAGDEFVDADGNVSPALRPVVDFLGEVERSRRATDLAVAALVEAAVIVPWQITAKTGNAEHVVNGLHRIDEAALGALPDDLFLKLRAASALPIAYAQLLSIGHLEIFERLTRLHAQLAPPTITALPKNLDSFYGLSTEDLMIKFD